ncbi:polysaccharide biosynthesis C-terminal domain-containing protein [Carboxydochorda subterranea]|uniref:Polysaccharide biosynthesis C-terminal domain-containing protein n=1 Tax=Carboxydichorda subterranea TaxID=3109565 RepID=A0ABZ1C242_9FIRM|nr:polysaccharide biosynthesis C-terminal domain-containing protein [Limnochorda sp. L945t]WRP18831.1 polysaccharide biosynthesis C-terminal domain-containing protein [Limnochorda sp. L945t]
MAGWFFASQMLAIGDRYVIRLFLGEGPLGIYSANYSLISSAAGLLSGPVTFAAFPIVMKLWADGEKERLVMLLRDMTGWYAVLGAGMVGGTALVAQDLVGVILGPEFRSGYPVLLPVVVGLAFWGASMLGHKSLELHERTTWMVLGALGSAALNFLLNLVFVPTYGITAAAYTTALSYGVYALFVWFMSRRTSTPWQLPSTTVLVCALAASIAYGAGLLPVPWAVTSPVAVLFEKAFRFVAVYVLVVLSSLVLGRRLRVMT